MNKSIIKIKCNLPLLAYRNAAIMKLASVIANHTGSKLLPYSNSISCFKNPYLNTIFQTNIVTYIPTIYSPNNATPCKFD